MPLAAAGFPTGTCPVRPPLLFLCTPLDWLPGSTPSVITNWPSQLPESDLRGPETGSRSDTCRTCANTLGTAHRAGTDCTHARRTSSLSLLSLRALCVPRRAPNLDSGRTALTKRHSDEVEEASRLIVGLRRTHHCDVHAPDLVYVIVVDLRKNDLLTNTQ